MASKQKNIFTRSKPLLNIYSSVDHEGKEVEVREDAEQLVKWHEISDALVAAGYYRAQLQGITPFDKIVGGLTWCIELCDIDVDISLSFEENLTIGKKIALTEKIVKILPSIKCPYIIEPHQIQGLDFINIYPLIQWLIKYSSEFREAKEDELRRFAVMQYEKNHIFESDRAIFAQKEKVLRNLAVIQNLYKPCRVRKRKGGLTGNELEQVNATLSEYDQRMLMHVSANKDDDEKDDGLDFLYDYEKTLADPSGITTEADRFKDQGTNVDTAETKIHYAVLQSELTGELPKELEMSEKLKYSEDVDRLTKAIDTMEADVHNFKKEHEERIANAKRSYTSMVAKLQKVTMKLMNTDANSDVDVKKFYKSLKDLAQERNELLQIIQHREKEHKRLEEELRLAQDPTAGQEEIPLTTEEMKEFLGRETKLKEFISSMRRELARLNREVLRYSVAIDEIPGTAELLQYEKRFMELYNQAKYLLDCTQFEGIHNSSCLTSLDVNGYPLNQIPPGAVVIPFGPKRHPISLMKHLASGYHGPAVSTATVASKHRETKQYYIFYNTLYEVKLYTSKELSLLNSILDNYEEAMSSARKREEFMSQFESIVDWVNQTVRKVDDKYKQEKESKNALHTEYSRLLEVQRQYAAALKKLAEERQKVGGRS